MEADWEKETKAGEIRRQEARSSVALSKMRIVGGGINLLKWRGEEESGGKECDTDGSIPPPLGLVWTFLTGIFSNHAGCVQVVCQTSVDPAPGIRGHLLVHGKFRITGRQLEYHRAAALP